MPPHALRINLLPLSLSISPFVSGLFADLVPSLSCLPGSWQEFFSLPGWLQLIQSPSMHAEI